MCKEKGKICMNFEEKMKENGIKSKGNGIKSKENVIKATDSIRLKTKKKVGWHPAQWTTKLRPDVRSTKQRWIVSALNERRKEKVQKTLFMSYLTTVWTIIFAKKKQKSSYLTAVWTIIFAKKKQKSSYLIIVRTIIFAKDNKNKQ